MYRNMLLASGLVCLLALGIGCGKQSPTPVSPSGTTAGEANAGADGSTLKATAPTVQSPTNNQLMESDIVLTIANAQVKYATAALSYRFQVFNSANAMVYESSLAPGGGSGTTSHTVTGALEFEKTYTWRARAEYFGAYGPWSGSGSFKTPLGGGYIRGSEVYDPLIDGKTVGETHGPITWIKGQGAKLEDFSSYISYLLPQTLFEGSYSLIIDNIPANTEGDKTKLFACGQGYDDIVTNDRRMTIEKRGDPAGIVAWRLMTHDDRIETEGPDRQYVDLQGDRPYYWEASWRSNFFNVIAREGASPNGPVMYDRGKPWQGRQYDPTPHVCYVGAPEGRSGLTAATVPGMIARQVWISGRPRPTYANK